ncbi:Cytochrome c oxidase subunit 6B [Lithohypha guttulata]|nr:Cytochrome c oxidase subunit 6B [Lithohypha guttulata]
MPDIEMPDPEDLGGNVTKPFKFVTAGYDARFPNQNQRKQDKALLAELRRLPQVRDCERRGFQALQTDDKQFYLAYRSLCPNSWVMRWNDQREAGNFPVDLEH